MYFGEVAAEIDEMQRNRSVLPEILLSRDWGGSDTFSAKGYRLSKILPGILIPQKHSCRTKLTN
jgi:hypothetical protein